MTNAEMLPLLKLGRAERFQLVEDLWESIVQEKTAETSLADWKGEELQARRERLLRNPDAARTWEQVKATARGLG